MGFFKSIGKSIKKLGYAVNKGFNTALPAVTAGLQVAGTVVGGPALGAAVASGVGAVAEAGGHPTLNAGNSGIMGFLGDLFGGGVSVETPDVSIQTGPYANTGINPGGMYSSPQAGVGVSVSGGAFGLPPWLKWVGIGLIGYFVLKALGLFKKKRR